MPLSQPSTQLNHLGPSHSTTCSHLPFRSNWSDGKAEGLINSAYLVQLPSIHLSHQPLLLPPSSPRLSSSFFTPTLSPFFYTPTLFKRSLPRRWSWNRLDHLCRVPHITTLSYLLPPRPTASRRFLPHPSHTLYLFRSPLFQTKSPAPCWNRSCYQHKPR